MYQLTPNDKNSARSIAPIRIKLLVKSNYSGVPMIRLDTRVDVMTAFLHNVVIADDFTCVSRIEQEEALRPDPSHP